MEAQLDELRRDELDRECVAIHGEKAMGPWREEFIRCVGNKWRLGKECCLAGGIAALCLQHSAAFSKYTHKTIERYLLRSQTPHSHDWSGVLFLAVHLRAVHLVERLLELGADVNVLVRGQTCVWIADQVNVRELLIERGADLNLYRRHNGQCGYYLEHAHEPAEHLLSLLRHVRNGVLDVFPCNPRLLTSTRGQDVLEAHGACCRDTFSRVGAASGLLPDLCAIVVAYAIPGAVRGKGALATGRE